jgi:hypothetical protein
MWMLLIAGTVAQLGGGGNLFPTTAAGYDGATKKGARSIRRPCPIFLLTITWAA